MPKLICLARRYKERGEDVYDICGKENKRAEMQKIKNIVYIMMLNTPTFLNSELLVSKGNIKKTKNIPPKEKIFEIPLMNVFSIPLPNNGNIRSKVKLFNDEKYKKIILNSINGIIIIFNLDSVLRPKKLINPLAIINNNIIKLIFMCEKYMRDKLSANNLIITEDERKIKEIYINPIISLNNLPPRYSLISIISSPGNFEKMA